MKYIFNSLLIIFFVTMMAREASAYIDPGVGSIFFQVLVGIIFGAVFTIKLWWKRLMIFLYKLSGKKYTDEED